MSKTTLADIERRKINPSYPYQIGQAYFLRTITYYYTGLLLAVTDQELVLDQVAWIADTGRFHEALRDGTFSEVEPFPDGAVIIGRSAIIDAMLWPHPLPREAK